jgi:hypothetical protein
MVNHVRTWLGNQMALSAMTPGEEYIDPLFVPVPTGSMSLELRTVRQILFPTNLSRYEANARLCTYMLMLHHSVLAPDITAKDSRLTYLPDGSGLFESDIPVNGITDLSGDILDQLGVINSSRSELFEGLPTYADIWSQPADPIKRLSAVLLAVAAATESAGVSAK